MKLYFAPLICLALSACVQPTTQQASDKPTVAQEASSTKSTLPSFKDVLDPVLASCIVAASGGSFDQGVLRRLNSRARFGGPTHSISFQRSKPNPFNLVPMKLTVLVHKADDGQGDKGCLLATVSAEDGAALNGHVRQTLAAQGFRITKLEHDGGFGATKGATRISLNFVVNIVPGNTAFVAHINRWE